MNRDLVPILACPGCRGALSLVVGAEADGEIESGTLECAACGGSYPIVRFVARLTDEDPSRMLPQEASMVKLACTELAKRCALEGVQIMGGYGYATEYPMERHLRAAVVTTIYGGTSEIQKNIIAKTLGL